MKYVVQFTLVNFQWSSHFNKLRFAVISDSLCTVLEIISSVDFADLIAFVMI